MFVDSNNLHLARQCNSKSSKLGKVSQHCIPLDVYQPHTVVCLSYKQSHFPGPTPSPVQKSKNILGYSAFQSFRL